MKREGTRERSDTMTPEERARQLIDARLEQSGWVVQDLKK